MAEFSWHDVYYGELQSLYALIVIPLGFLAWRMAAGVDLSRAAAPTTARFVSGLTLFFAIETMIDPVATGPLLELDFLAESKVSILIPFVFVLLGDLRVLLLAIGVARPDRTLRHHLVWALRTALIVPVFAGVGFALAGWIWPDLHSQVLWMIYEFGFLVLCIFLARVWLPRNVPGESPTLGFLKTVFGYSAAYYALWLFADVLIVVADLDLGWAIRIIPNQLYYAIWAPFVYWRFFGLRPENASR